MDMKDISDLIASKLDFHQIAEQFVQHHQLEETRNLVDALMHKLSQKLNEDFFNEFNGHLEDKLLEIDTTLASKADR